MPRSPGVADRWMPRSPGLLVLVVGVPACVAPLLLLFPGYGALPVVLAWSVVYGYAGNVAQRWPWWVMGQWVSLCVVFAVEVLITHRNVAFTVAAAVPATLMLALWMVPVALVSIHRHHWATPRPTDPAVGPEEAAPTVGATSPRP